MSDFTFGLGIFLFILGGSLIASGYYLCRKIAPLHTMLYFMAVFTFLIGSLVLLYPGSFERMLN